MPAEFIAEMGSTPEWAKMVSVAHTPVFDCMISDATTSAVLGPVEVPAPVRDSEGTSDDLQISAVASQAAETARPIGP